MKASKHPAALDQLRAVPFVTKLGYTAENGLKDRRYGGRLKIRTPAGSFDLMVEVKNAYLSSAAIHQLVGRVNSRSIRGRRRGVILLARYIPRATGQDLIAHHVNFADRAGNVHLELGPTYSWTILGVPEELPIQEKRPASPAQLELLFEFVTNPDSVNWPVRQLERPAGVSKSNVAKVRSQLIAQGLLVRRGGKYQLGPPALISERLLNGYSQVLRPKLLIGRFRYADTTAKSLLDRLKNTAVTPIRYALTGGPAANILQNYYRGSDIALFLDPWDRSTPQKLRLLPDRQGPVHVLRAFGEVVFWREEQGHMLAPPWLTYAELLSTTDPRAHEAAEEFRSAFLP